MSDLPEPLTLTRTIQAPRQKVWEAWTKPEQFAQWFAPEHFSIPEIEADPQVGGKLYLEMQDPNGTRYPMSATYQVLDEPEKLVMLSTPLDGDGNPLFEIEQTAELVEENGQTTLTVTNKVLSATQDAAPYLAGMKEGLTQSLNKLEKLVASN